MNDAAEIEELLCDKLIKESDVFGETDISGVWFRLLQDRNTAGVINLRAINNVTWVPHIFLFPEYRMNGSEKWGKLVARFMRKNLGAEKFLVFTPFRSARKYAERVGFKHVAVLEKSVLKDNELLDQVVMEL